MLSEYARIDFDKTQSILNQYLERRSRIEVSGNKQPSKLHSILSRIKQATFVKYNIVDNLYDVLQILNQEDLGQQNKEKIAIANVCREFLEMKGNEWT